MDGARWGALALAALLGCLGPGCEGDGAEAVPQPDATVDVPPGLDTGNDGLPADATDGAGLGLDYPSLEPGARPRWEPASEDWTAVPWPSDLRRRPDGGPDLAYFPVPPATDFVEFYADYGQQALDGYGLNGAMYVELDGPVDVASLPAPQVVMGDPKSPIQLVNVTTGSLRYGERLPLLFAFHEGLGDPYYRPNTLAVRPPLGFPLAEDETYCLVVTRGVLDASGRHLSPAEGFAEALRSDATLAPLAAWLPASGLVEADVAVASCFTTQRATLGLRQVRAFLQSQPAPQLANLTYLGKANVFYEFQGEYLAPNFQQGSKPYQDQGGGIVTGADGLPVIQQQETVRFLLMVPSAFKMPAAGWPVLLYGHGTGGDFLSCKAGALAPATDVLREGVAMICIDQPLHGARGEPEWNLELLSFNVANPAAARSNFRQAAIDVMNLARAVAGGAFDLPAGTTKHPDDVRFDPTQIHYFGHSHGGLSGALALGVEPLLGSGVLSGAGGGLIETILRRKDILDFRELAAGAAGIPADDLDAFHPVMTLVQMLVDVTDPVNYARYWLEPAAGGTPKHVLVTEGLSDAATPAVGTNAMAAAGGLAIAEPVRLPSLAHELRGLAPVPVPVASNVLTSTGARKTAVLAQWEGSHFVAFEDGEARSYWRSFFKSIRFGQPPVVGPLP